MKSLTLTLKIYLQFYYGVFFKLTKFKKVLISIYFVDLILSETMMYVLGAKGKFDLLNLFIL